MTSCFKGCDKRCEDTKEMVRIRSVGIKVRKLKSPREKWNAPMGEKRGRRSKELKVA
jgi:hypothetical protein